MEPPLPLPLALLARASDVTLGPVGVAAVETPEYVAYGEARAHAAEYAEHIAWMLVHATPAGRFYAALLTGAQSAEAAARAWASLEKETAVVSLWSGGCGVLRAPLGHFAISVRASGTFFGALPPWRDPDAPAAIETRPRRRSLLDRTLTWFDENRGLVAAVFWCIAGIAYVVWRLVN
jgi:hypothetical protein